MFVYNMVAVQLDRFTILAATDCQHSLSLLVPHSAWSIGLFTVSFHLFLSIAVIAASVHVLNPIWLLSFSTVLLHVSLGRPLFLFPSGAQFSAVLGNESGFILNTWPIHVHLRVLICVLNLSDPVLSLTSSFVTFIGQWFSEFFVSICVGSYLICPHPF